MSDQPINPATLISDDPAGAPEFSGGNAGLGVFVGPTAGYLNPLRRTAAVGCPYWTLGFNSHLSSSNILNISLFPDVATRGYLLNSLSKRAAHQADTSARCAHYAHVRSGCLGRGAPAHPWNTFIPFTIRAVRSALETGDAMTARSLLD